VRETLGRLKWPGGTRPPAGRSLLAGAALFAAVTLTPPLQAGQSAASGAVTGNVRLTTRVRGTPLPANAYQPRGVGRQAAGGAPEIRNVVVYLRGATPRGPLVVATHEIRQEGEAFHPRVLAITRGSSVSFPNADPFFHNVFSLSSAATFNLGRFPQQQTRVREFAKPGLIKVYCQIHSHMSATILVLDHPYFAVPELDGTFALEGVPAGRYTLVGWHERVGERTSPVEITAGARVSVDLALPVED
jgi:plastocyanin